MSFHGLNYSSTHGFELVTGAFEPAIRKVELITREFERVTCKVQFVIREFELVTLNSHF